MVKKKLKSGKKGRKQEPWQKDDVTVYTGLPPQVEGQLRCYVRLAVTQIIWLIPSPPDVSHVRVKWWGEAGDGAIFRPYDAKKGNKEFSRTLARYPVRAGPKQFAAYLNDMTSLVLELVTSPSMQTVARASVASIAALAPNRPISGVFPLMSAEDEKVADLQVAIAIEAIMASYDSASSIPTPDMSVDVHSSWNSDFRPVQPPQAHPIPQPKPAYSSGEDPFASPTNRKFPRGVDEHIYGSKSTQVNGTTSSSQPARYPVANQKLSAGMGTTIVGSSQSVKTSGEMPPSACNLPDFTLSQGGHVQGDLVSELLERGNKLRKAMIVATLDETAVRDGLPHTTALDALQSTGTSSTSILKKTGVKDFLEEPQLAASLGKSVEFADMDAKAIELVLGPGTSIEDWKLLQMGSPGSSVDGDEIFSDIGDPIHDEDILQELFYKNQESDEEDLSVDLTEDCGLIKKSASMNSLDDVGNRRPPSFRSSNSSLHLDDKPVRDTDGPCSLPASPARRSARGTPAKGKKKSLSSPSLTPKKSKPPLSPQVTPRNNKLPSSSHGTPKKLQKSTTENSPQTTPKKSQKKMKKSKQSDLLHGSRDFNNFLQVSKVSVQDRSSSDVPDVGSTFSGGQDQHTADGLTVGQLTLLGRVHAARVIINSLDVMETAEDVPDKKGKARSRGKPPRPEKKNCTYFVEYQFPVVTAKSPHVLADSSMGTEVIRVASKKVEDGVVTFGHRSVFPVRFDGTVIEKWWKSALLFKVYSKTNAQKMPSLLGLCSVPLQSILQSDSLHLDVVLEVRDRSQSSRNSSPARSTSSRRGSLPTSPLVGHIRISIELVCNGQHMGHGSAKAHNLSGGPKVLISKSAPINLEINKNLEGTASTKDVQHMPYRQAKEIDNMYFRGTDSKPPIHKESPKSKEQSLTLHTLLMIPRCSHVGVQRPGTLKHPHSAGMMNGQLSGDVHGRNPYLVCRMFWCEEQVHSNVCWGSGEPQFNFMQVAPVLLTENLLGRFKNNFMVVEVWDKKTSNNDELVGIVKLPLHQFFLSYRDPKLASALMNSKYPVVATDTEWPVISPFSGATCGQLQVLLAMGSLEQIGGLQQLRSEGGGVLGHPAHQLDRHQVPSSQWQNPLHAQGYTVEHVFEVSVESAQGLQLVDTMIWGEADCFVQYHFPTQETPQQHGAPVLIRAAPSLKAFRTATTLCVPDPVFSDITRHRLLLPEGTPVQREILTACAGVGGGGGGVQFELWCRYYYPNVRDQVMAKVLLPLAKLCGMVTMQRRGVPSTQTFSLPLSQVSVDSHHQHADKVEMGLLNVTISYKCHSVQPGADVNGLPAEVAVGGNQVCVTVGVLRASGLQTAARCVAATNRDMEYPAEVGVNAYVRVHLSFQQKEAERLTRTVARSFAPEFSSHFDFSLPLVTADVGASGLSLAQTLEEASVILEVWHQVPLNTTDLGRHYQFSDTGGRTSYSSTEDVLLGCVGVPLHQLLSKNTGVKGWHAVHLPQSQLDNEGHHVYDAEQTVGGLELVVKFGRHDDLTRVLHAAQGLGWTLQSDVEDASWEETDETADYHHEMSVAVEHVFFPSCLALSQGKHHLEAGAYCYVRYKVYDQAAVCSHQVSISEDEDEYVDAAVQHNHTEMLPHTPPLLWYLLEECLEIQVWVTRHPETSSKRHPSRRDKLIGTAYINLSSLADRRRKQHRISGVFPLFKPGATGMGGACIHAQLTWKQNEGPLRDQGKRSFPDEMGETPSPRRRMPKSDSRQEQILTVNLAATFAVTILIDRAYHLPDISDKASGESMAPSAYVSYQTAESEEPSCTAVCPSSANPLWDHNHDTRVHRALLEQHNKNLVFKVWHKSGAAPEMPDKSTDQVLGFVSVDLAPLVAGFHQVAGFYHIVDLSGHCQGQIKISVTPIDNLAEMGMEGNQQVSVCEPHTSTLFSTLPTAFSWQGRQTSLLDLPSANTLSRFAEHYQNVRQFHESLTQHSTEAGTAAEEGASSSRSFLLTNLRTNLSELDKITQTLKQKLSLPGQEEPDGSTLSNPLSNTTHNLPISQEAGIPHGTGSSMANTLGSAAQRSSSLSATTTFLGVPGSHLSDAVPSTADPVSAQSHCSSSHKDELDYGQPELMNTMTSLGSAGQLNNTYGSGLSGGFVGAHTLLSTLGSGVMTWNLEEQETEGQKSVHFDPASDHLTSTFHAPHNGTEDLTTMTQVSVSPPVQASKHLHDRSAEVVLDVGDDAVDYIAKRQSHIRQEPFQVYQSQLHDSDRNSSDEGADVIVPRPLNDVSSADFYSRNTLPPSHFNKTLRDPLAELRRTEPAPNIQHTSLLSEEDSWMSFPQHHDKTVETVGSGLQEEHDTPDARERLPEAESCTPWAPLHHSDGGDIINDNDVDAQPAMSEDVLGFPPETNSLSGTDSYTQQWIQSTSPRHQLEESKDSYDSLDHALSDNGRERIELTNTDENHHTNQMIHLSDTELVQSESPTSKKTVSRTTHGGTPQKKISEQLASREKKDTMSYRQFRAAVQDSSSDSESDGQVRLRPSFKNCRRKGKGKSGGEHVTFNSEVITKSASRTNTPSTPSLDAAEDGFQQPSYQMASQPATKCGEDNELVETAAEDSVQASDPHVIPGVAADVPLSGSSSARSQHSGDLSSRSEKSSSSVTPSQHSQTQPSGSSGQQSQNICPRTDLSSKQHIGIGKEGGVSAADATLHGHNVSGGNLTPRSDLSVRSQHSNTTLKSQQSSQPSKTSHCSNQNSSSSEGTNHISPMSQKPVDESLLETSSATWPNFFPQANQMGQTMQALSTNKREAQAKGLANSLGPTPSLHHLWATQGRLQERFNSTISGTSRMQGPDKAQAQRIAKIFAAKFSS